MLRPTVLGTAVIIVMTSFSTAFAGDDVLKKGAKHFKKKCKACHLNSPNGPDLTDIIDRKIASVEGFSYSKALKDKGDAGEVWTEENLTAFLTKPSAFAKGTKMGFAGFRKKEKRTKAVIEYLKTLKSAEEPAKEAAE